MDSVRNFAKVEVLTGYTSLDLLVDLEAGHGDRLPEPLSDNRFNLVWWNSTDYPNPDDDPLKEIVRVTSRTADQLTILRAQEDTSAEDHNLPGKIYLMILTMTKSVYDDLTLLAMRR